jgi:hypothetical protein
VGEQQSQTTTTALQESKSSACPHPEAVGKRWGDPISEERQAELQGYLDRWAAEADHGARKGPFDGGPGKSGVQLTGADIYWLCERVRDDRFDHVTDLHLEGAWVFAAHMEGADLSGAHLERVQFNLESMERNREYSAAELLAGHLEGAWLSEAHLEGANLFRAHLNGANLGGAHLEGANLARAHLEGAFLRYAWLDSGTALTYTLMSDKTLLGDVHWSGVGGVNLTQIGWERVNRLGDEQYSGPPADEGDVEVSVRAYRQLATQLRAQGLNEVADRFAYRAQVCQRIVSRRQHHYLRYIGSLLLDLLAGYGYRPGRAILLYLAVIVWFANLYVWATHGVLSFGLAPSQFQPLPWYEALVLSVSSFHGRGFLPFPNLGDPVTILAAIEAVFGLVIEVSFIATFTQRFFAR